MKNSIIIPSGAIVLDYATWRPSIAQLDAIGASGVLRYLAQATTLPGKLVTADEIVYYHNGGVAVGLNYESSRSDFDGGYSRGRVNGLFSSTMAESYNYPLDVPVWVSDDTNVGPTNIATHLAYAEGFRDGVLPWEMGIYGDNDILNAAYVSGITRWLWYAGAKSWSSGKPPIEGCNVEQTVKDSTPSYDMNRVLLPFPMWLPNQKEDTDMRALTNLESYTLPEGTFAPGVVKWVTDGIVKRRMTAEYGKLFPSDPGLALTNVELDAIPDYKAPSGSSPVGGSILLQLTGEATGTLTP